MDESQLKARLEILSKNKFHISENEDISILIPEMLLHIGSIDSYLRDNLIYSAFATWIYKDKLIDEEQLRFIAQTVLDDQHLFFQIGEENTDSVFTRSFSVLLLPPILIRNREKPFLSKLEIERIKESLLRYLHSEKDLRSFVPEKGWADAVAHSADAVDDLVQCQEINKNDLEQFLVWIRSIICNQDLAYHHGEEERLSTAVIAIINRQMLSDADLSGWIQGFTTYLLAAKDFPERLTIRTNIKNFLQSLYFRLRWESPDNSLLTTINQTLLQINPYTPKANN